MSQQGLFPEAAFDVVAIGASLGGMNALSRVLSGLPYNFPAAITVVQHLHPTTPTDIDKILRQNTALKVWQVRNEEPLREGNVYIAPPDRHLLVNTQGNVFTSTAPKTNYARPSVDVLFNSVALSFGRRSIAVVLTGKLSDGAEGARVIKQSGGRVLIQDKATSDAFGMPWAAIQTGAFDFMRPLEKIASALITLVMTKGAEQLFYVHAAPSYGL